MTTNLIAFTGFAHSGKDEAAKILLAAGYERRCFGDIIKAQADELIHTHLGFSAFTEVPEEKQKIRRTLESWGEDNYAAVFEEFFKDLPEKCVNTRLCRLREAQEWTKRGGIIIAILKPGLNAETPWSHEQFESLKKAGLIFCYIINDGTPEQLHEKLLDALQFKPAVALPSTPTLAAVQKSAAAVAHVAAPTLAELDTNPALMAEAAALNPAPKDKDGFEEFVEETEVLGTPK